MAEKSKVRKNVYLLHVLINRNIRNQYAGSFLGVLWTVLNPLLNMIVMAIVFANIFGTESIGLDYPVYVLSGNIIFNLFRSATESALTGIVDQRDLLSKTRVPLWIIPASRVGSSVVSFGFSYIALILVMLIRIPAGVHFYWSMVMVLAVLPALIIFSLGFALFLSTLYVSFRDIKHFYNVILTLWMYLTPLFYSIETLNLSDKMVKLMRLNPMYQFVYYFRTTLCGNWTSWSNLGICYLWAVVAFIIGYSFFEIKKNKLLVNA